MVVQSNLFELIVLGRIDNLVDCIMISTAAEASCRNYGKGRIGLPPYVYSSREGRPRPIKPFGKSLRSETSIRSVGHIVSLFKEPVTNADKDGSMNLLRLSRCGPCS